MTPKNAKLQIFIHINIIIRTFNVGGDKKSTQNDRI